MSILPHTIRIGDHERPFAEPFAKAAQAAARHGVLARVDDRDIPVHRVIGPERDIAIMNCNGEVVSHEIKIVEKLLHH